MITIEQLDVIEQLAPHFARVHDLSYEQAVIQLVRGYEMDSKRPLKAAEHILSLPLTPGITPADVLSPQIQTHPPAHDTETPTVVLDEVIMDDELGPLPSVEELESQPVNDDQPPVVEGDGFDPEDDGSWGYGQGKKGTRWHKAHAHLMAVLDEHNIKRIPLKHCEGIKTFKDLDAAGHKALVKKVERAMYGVDMFHSAESIDILEGLWDGVIEEFGEGWHDFFVLTKRYREQQLLDEIALGRRVA